MTADGLKVSDDVFGALQTSVSSSRDQLRSTTDAASEAAGAVGYHPLADRLNTFSGNWRIHREKLVAALDKLESQIVKTGEGLHAADEEGKKEADDLAATFHFPTASKSDGGSSTGASAADSSGTQGGSGGGSGAATQAPTAAAVGGAAALGGAALLGSQAVLAQPTGSAATTADATPEAGVAPVSSAPAVAPGVVSVGESTPGSGLPTSVAADSTPSPVATSLPGGPVDAPQEAAASAGDPVGPDSPLDMAPADPGTGSPGGGASGVGGGSGPDLPSLPSGGALPSGPELGGVWHGGHHSGGHHPGQHSHQANQFVEDGALHSVAESVGSSLGKAGHAVGAHAESAGGVMGGAAMGGMAAMGAGGAGRSQDPGRDLSDDERVHRARAALEELRRESNDEDES